MTNIADRILNKFLSSPTGQKLNKEVVKEDQKARRKHVQEIKRLRAEAEEKYPQKAAREESLRRHCEEMKQACDSAQMELDAAIREHQSESFRVDSLITQHEKALRDSAHPAIDSFCKEMRQLYDTVRHSQTGGNVKQVLRGIGAASERAESLKYQVVDDVQGTIEDLRSSIQAYAHDVELVEA